MTDYTDLAVELDETQIVANAVARLQARYPAWRPDPAAIETLIIKVGAALESDLAYALTVVAKGIFKIYGEQVLGLPVLDAQPASVPSTWTATDNAGHTIAAGTQVLIDDGTGTFVTFEVASDVVIAPGNTVTGAGAVTLVAVTAGAAGNGLTGPVESNDAIAWLSSIALTGTTAGGVDEEDEDTYLARLKRYTALMTPAPILPQDFADLALSITGVGRSMAYDGYNPQHNLFSANASSCEVDVSDYNTSPTNCAVAQSNTQAADQTFSCRLTASSAADMSVRSKTGLNGRAVNPNQKYTFSAFFRAGGTGRSVKVGARFYDAGGSLIGAVAYGTPVADSNAGWTEATYTVVSPSNAAFAAIELFVTAPLNTEIHYCDKMQIREGASSSPWVIGGTAATGNLATIAVALAGPDGAPVPSLIATQVQTYLDGLREVGFSVYTMDPVVTTVAVTYQIKVATGADSTATIAAVNAALQDYLSSANWGKTSAYSNPTSESWVYANKVRMDELYTLINNTAGVDYVESLLINGSAANLTISGPAPLTTPGVMTGTTV